MTEIKSCRNFVIWTIVITSVVTFVAPFSYSRLLHDVNQDVDVQTDFESAELDKNILPELAESSKTQERRLQKYVSIKEHPSRHVTVMKGHRLELKCEVDGNPPPLVYWIKGNNSEKYLEEINRESFGITHYTSVARDVSKYIINCAKPEDNGMTLLCVGVTADKMVISPPTIVTVIDNDDSNARDCEQKTEEIPKITRYRPLYISEIGSSVVLPCEAIGNPKPRIYWVNGEDKKLQDKRFSVQSDGSLVIGSLRWADMDNYKCIAESELGIDEALTFLYPAAKVRNSSFTNYLNKIVTIIRHFIPNNFEL